MKKLLALVLALVLFALPACANAKESTLFENISTESGDVTVFGVEYLCSAEELLEKLPEAKLVHDNKKDETIYLYTCEDRALGGNAYVYFYLYYDILVEIRFQSVLVNDDETIEGLWKNGQKLVKTVAPHLKESLPELYENYGKASGYNSIEEAMLEVPGGTGAHYDNTRINFDFTYHSGETEDEIVGYYFVAYVEHNDHGLYDSHDRSAQINAENFHAAKNQKAE